MTSKKPSHSSEVNLTNRVYLDFFEAAFPSLVIALIRQGLIEAEDVDLNNQDKLKAAFKASIEDGVFEKLLEEIVVSTKFGDEFLEVAKHAKSRGANYASIVLIATTIEHELNYYYRSNMVLSRPEITQAIRQTSLQAKTGWLFHLVSSEDFPEDLRRDILKIADLRNSIVHYKAEGKPLASIFDEQEIDSYDKIKKAIGEIGMEAILELPDKVKSFLNRFDTGKDYRVKINVSQSGIETAKNESD